MPPVTTFSELPSNLQERVMASAATWSDAGRLRVAEPALARRSPLHRDHQQRVLTQVAKLLEFARASDCGIVLKAAGDANDTTITNFAGAYTIDEYSLANRRKRRNWRMELLETVEEVLRFLSARAIVELRLTMGTHDRNTADIAFQGDGLDTVVWDTYRPPEWAVTRWQQRMWKLLTYIQTCPAISLVPDLSRATWAWNPVKWTGGEFRTEETSTADIRQLMDGIAQSATIGLVTFTCTLYFEPPNYSNPWD